MNGALFKYGPGSAHLAFKSPAPKQHPLCTSGELHLVLVGGLTDGKDQRLQQQQAHLQAAAAEPQLQVAADKLVCIFLCGSGGGRGGYHWAEHMCCASLDGAAVRFRIATAVAQLD